MQGNPHEPCVTYLHACARYDKAPVSGWYVTKGARDHVVSGPYSSRAEAERALRSRSRT